MCYRAVVVFPQGNYLGLAIAEEVVDLDSRNLHAVLEKAKQIGIASVVTTGTYVAESTIGYLADWLGLAGKRF